MNASTFGVEWSKFKVMVGSNIQQNALFGLVSILKTYGGESPNLDVWCLMYLRPKMN